LKFGINFFHGGGQNQNFPKVFSVLRSDFGASAHASFHSDVLLHLLLASFFRLLLPCFAVRITCRHAGRKGL